MTRAQPASSGKATAATRARRYPIGAEPDAGGLGTHLRVWAPRCQRVVVRFGEGLASSAPLPAEAGGYFAGVVRGLRAGDRYGFQLDDDGQVYPDPASRFQPEGPHGPSEVVDGRAFAWSDHEWRGSGARGQVIYELHVGTFTETGTYAAATERLADLRDLGVTLIELMPLAEFPGRFGWGYDGVDLWAPTRLYGRPDDLRGFVDAAHRLGMGVILDVVYNHVGPDGNYLARFSADYFTDRYANEWGAALNFDGDNAGPARELFVENAAYWIDEFHFDGLRLDATQQIYDASPEHLVAAVARRVREAAGERATFLVAENEPQDAKLVRAVESRRLRARRALERRLPPQRGRRADRAQRGVLLRLPRARAGAGLGDSLGIPVPGPALLLAEEAPRHGGAGSAARRASCSTSRTTIRSRTPAARGWRQSSRPPTCAR